MFVPYGRIYSLAAYEGLLGVRSCIGAKHSSLSRAAEWDRLALRDRVRPDFHVFTGNDLAIDMVCYGSDYLLGPVGVRAGGVRRARPALGSRRAVVPRAQRPAAVPRRSSRSARRSPRTATTRRCSCSSAVGSTRTRHRPARRDVPTATAPCSPTSRSGWRRCCDRRRDRPGEAPAHDRRAPRPARGARHRRPARRRRRGRPARTARARPSRSSTARPARTPWATGSRCCPWRGGTARPTDDPSDLVRRRWRRFGESGAKLVWGGEAVAVRHDGRANPRQLVIDRTTVDDLAALRAELVGAHVAAHGSDDGLVVGLQLTHSGRWSRPTGASQPRIAYHHPVLDRRVAAEATVVLSDDDLDELVADLRRRGRARGRRRLRLRRRQALPRLPAPRAARRGRPAGRLRRVVRAPHRVPATRGRAHPRPRARRSRSACACRRTTSCPTKPTPTASARRCPTHAEVAATRSVATRRASAIDLTETHRFLDLCRELGIGLVCITAGSPYYNPHIQRPAFFPPSDGYTPPEDPLVGAARMIAATAELARAHPDVAIVGSGLLVPPAVAPPRRAARGAHRRRRVGRHRPRHAQLPAPAGRRPRGPAARDRRGCAARSATAPRRPATVWSRAATRSTTSTRTSLSASSSRRSRRRHGSARVDDIAPGLCSITFRSLTADDVIRRRVPRRRRGHRMGRRRPRAARRRSDDRRARGPQPSTPGVEVVSYGSYLGMAPPTATDDAAVDAVLDTASALGAPMVRIWTEFGVTPASSPAERRRVTERTAALVDRIADARPARRARVPPVHAHRDRGVGHRAPRRARSTRAAHALATRSRALACCRARRARRS